MTRPQIGKFARELRLKFGPEIFVREALESVGNSPRVVLGGLRAVPEADLVHKLGGKIVCIDAPAKVRFERAFIRQRADDNVSFQEFERVEQSESAGQLPTDQNLHAVIAMAHCIVPNCGTPQDLFLQLDKLVVSLKLPRHT